LALLGLREPHALSICDYEKAKLGSRSERRRSRV